MSELSGAAILLLILLGGSALGVFVRRFLSERHRSQETNDLIRLVVTMLVTFAALVLGLLTSSVKASFDTVDNDLRGVAIHLIQLDRSLRIYGSETDAGAHPAPQLYRRGDRRSTWATEPKPTGGYHPGRTLQLRPITHRERQTGRICWRASRSICINSILRDPTHR